MLAILARRAAPGQLRAAYLGFVAAGRCLCDPWPLPDRHISRSPTLTRRDQPRGRACSADTRDDRRASDYEAGDGPVSALAEGTLARYAPTGSALTGPPPCAPGEALNGAGARGQPGEPVVGAVQSNSDGGGSGPPWRGAQRGRTGALTGRMSGGRAAPRRARGHDPGRDPPRPRRGRSDFGHTDWRRRSPAMILAELTAPMGHAARGLRLLDLGRSWVTPGAPRILLAGSCVVVEEEGPSRSSACSKTHTREGCGREREPARRRRRDFAALTSNGCRRSERGAVSCDVRRWSPIVRDMSSTGKGAEREAGFRTLTLSNSEPGRVHEENYARPTRWAASRRRTVTSRCPITTS